MSIIVALASFLISAFAVILVIGAARRLKIVDTPKKDGRRVHKKPIPLLGGSAIFIAILIVTTIVLMRSDALVSGEVTAAHYIALLISMLILVIGGGLDDKFNLKPQYQILFPVLAALVAIGGGLGVEKLTNPFGGVLFLEAHTWDLFKLGAHNVAFSWPGDIIVFLWLMGMMYTTKLLDGLDGLATSIGSVGALVVLLLASTVAYLQPDIVVFAAIVFGALIGFLVWNMHPAKIFLGEGGALLVGFVLGSLAVLSGGKVATLLLVMGVPILDVVWVMYRRRQAGRKVSKADRLHLHHRLYDLGMTQRDVVFFYTFLASMFGVMTLFLSSMAKLIALIGLSIVVLAGAFFLISLEKKAPRTRKGQGRS
ncbi:undecaprenyl/decaprenyl-phosphate alpha-N-acetylglucosaminyl 1-phosphate transferase [Candidatus Uhrbacteria bacterium]|jgi:UDP-GlcNAc:undecaprenyl-phosphate/decaprenyl-phosphate GlcNAc-1-phosphate transferase|nr:undecaprenyl/decaprenyl-phosphate alpha-N-acetylglucosaminyl 1-phosphate transferase [Candidatus Uhrbacteria bacterium]